MNERNDVSYRVVEELFNMVNKEISARWAKRRPAAEAEVKVHTQESGYEDSAIASGNLRQLKPNLRNR